MGRELSAHEQLMADLRAQFQSDMDMADERSLEMRRHFAQSREISTLLHRQILSPGTASEENQDESSKPDGDTGTA